MDMHFRWVEQWKLRNNFSIYKIASNIDTKDTDYVNSFIRKVMSVTFLKSFL